MAQSETQIQVSQPEVKSPQSTNSSVPHLWNDMLGWYNSEMQTQISKFIKCYF